MKTFPYSRMGTEREEVDQQQDNHKAVQYFIFLENKVKIGWRCKVKISVWRLTVDRKGYEI